MGDQPCAARYVRERLLCRTRNFPDIDQAFFKRKGRIARDVQRLDPQDRSAFGQPELRCFRRQRAAKRARQQLIPIRASARDDFILQIAHLEHGGLTAWHGDESAEPAPALDQFRAD